MIGTSSQYSAAESLERFLGDPFQPDNVFSFRNAVLLDEKESFPADAFAALCNWNLHHYYVPRDNGGCLSSFEEVLALVRTVARRDLTLAIAHTKTYLGAAAVWIAGDHDQKKVLADIIKSRGQVSLALTEHDHGSDLLANEVAADEFENGYVLNGQKWLINNATRGDALVVFARTNTEGGPRGFSLFLVVKERLEQGTFSYLPKLATHGVRGMDMSGINFKKCFLDAKTLVGPKGHGLEITLKLLQVTRSLCTALSLGSADTAMRATLDFAVRRRLYGRSVFDIPHARSTLVKCFVELLICECVAVATARMLHTAPRQMSLHSSIAKYFVPLTIESTLRKLATILGARHYLRDGHWNGIFQKIQRDHGVVPLFDGSTIVNLESIATSLSLIGSAERSERKIAKQDRYRRLHETFCLRAPLPSFQSAELRTSGRGENLVLSGLDLAVEDMNNLDKASCTNLECTDTIRRLAMELFTEASRFTTHIPTETEQHRRSAVLFDRARRYSLIHAAACCLHLWLQNRSRAKDDFSRGHWLVLALDYLLGRSGRCAAVNLEHSTAIVGSELLDRFGAGADFGIIPMVLAEK
jgi:alkylation response protein AidB-like acyl-CoA dehydrogenase